MVATASDRAKPMSSAPLRYQDDGSVDWGRHVDSFCELARDGGPPHRGTLLEAGPIVDSNSPAYQAAVREIAERGLRQ